MKRLMLFALLVVLAPSIAFAGDDLRLCLGRPIASLTAAWKKNGGRLLRWDAATCGGRLGQNGEPVPKWPCFWQEWNVPTVGLVRLYYGQIKGVPGWLLAFGIRGDRTLMDLPACAEGDAS